MQDMLTHLEKLRTDAAECALIRDLTTDIRKRELFTKLAEHLASLAAEVEKAIATAAQGRQRHVMQNTPPTRNMRPLPGSNGANECGVRAQEPIVAAAHCHSPIG